MKFNSHKRRNRMNKWMEKRQFKYLVFVRDNGKFFTFKCQMNLSSGFISVCFFVIILASRPRAVLFLRSSKFKRQFSRQHVEHSNYSNKRIICKALVSNVKVGSHLCQKLTRKRFQESPTSSILLFNWQLNHFNVMESSSLQCDCNQSQ